MESANFDRVAKSLTRRALITDDNHGYIELTEAGRVALGEEPA